MKIPFTQKDLLVHVPLSAPKVNGERVEHPTIKQRFADYGWLPVRMKPADRHSRRPGPQSLQALIASMAQQRTPTQAATAPAQGKPLSGAEVDEIAEAALTTYQAWNKADSASMAKGTVKLNDDHIRMAAVLDAIYKRHFGSKFDRKSVDEMPDDRSLQHVLVETFRSEEGIGTGMRLGASMQARETLRILYDGFDQVPHLRDIDPDQRWRLIVDRQKIDMLAKHGIDTRNPLLCFLFDSDRGYAHGVARGYEAMGRLRAQGRTLDAALIPELAMACGAGTLDPAGKQYGAVHTLEGARALVHWMKCIHTDHKVQPGAVFGDQVFTFKNGQFFIGQHDRKSRVVDVERARKPIGEDALRSLIESTFDGDTKYIAIERATTNEKTLKKIDKEIVQRFEAQSKAASTPDEKTLAAGRVYYDGEHKHGQADGNYRLFGKMILNFALLQQGEPMTELHDPMRTDGQSPKELVNAIKEGQTWLASLCPNKATTS